jgi:Zn-dependent M28 family amino/carboxypeptidase
MKVRVRKQFRAAALVSIVAALGFAARPAPQELSSGRFMRHVGFLASAELKGRGNGSIELDRAAEHIATEFEAYGLEPVGKSQSFVQEFPITVGKSLGPLNALQVNGREQQAGTDFVTLPLSASATYDGEAVFAGYGINAPQLGWDDYAGIDVTGKAVIVLTYHPPVQVLSVRSLGSMSSFEMKVRAAKKHGARAILFVRDPGFETDSLAGIDTRHIVTHDLGLPAFYVSPRSIEPLFQQIGATIGDAKRRIDTALRPASFALPGSALQLTTDVRRVTRTARNVIAAIPGADPARRREWLVIGAHYDHLGHSHRHDGGTSTDEQTHYGADDNASGTAGLLELARVLAQNRSALSRSILFVAFAGEEVGLIGSGHFVEHLSVPSSDVTAMLNLDMIGRLSREPLIILGAGVPANVAELIRRENKDVGLSLMFATADSASSDWAVFQTMGIPALTFFTGMHEDYHRPSDTADKINADGAMKVLALVKGTVQRAASRAYVVHRRPFPQALVSVDSGRPYFGPDPVYHDHLDALRLANMPLDSPAAKAGLRPGDRVVEFGEFPITTLKDFRVVLDSFNPGDMPTMNVVREGKLHRTVVTLEHREE